MSYDTVTAVSVLLIVLVVGWCVATVIRARHDGRA